MKPTTTTSEDLAGPKYSSIPRGDIVMTNLPPYLERLWLIVGLPYLAAILRDGGGLATRICKVLPDTQAFPPEIADFGIETFVYDVPREERRRRTAAFAERHPALFERILEKLLVGGEQVFGFSVFMMNADFTIELSRQLKEQRPSAYVVLGGPEVIQNPSRFDFPWIDVTVGAHAETVIVPLMECLLERRPERAAALRNVWVNPIHTASAPGAIVPEEARPVPPRPLLDYATIGPLLLQESPRFFPLMLNVGCRNGCAFCTNRAVYPEFVKGPTDPVIAEVSQIMNLLRDADEATVRGTNIMFCDSTVNEHPEQLEEICQAIIDRGQPYNASLLGNLVFGPKLGERTVRKMLDAGFHHFYFGLESGSPAVRRSMRKPSRIEDVVAAMELVQRLQPGSIGVSVIVGWPTETEADFQETMALLERATRAGMLNEIIVHVPVLIPAMNDQSAFANNRGATYGVLWENDAPAGLPEVRRRRLMTLYERFRRDVKVVVPFWQCSRLKRWAFGGGD